MKISALRILLATAGGVVCAIPAPGAPDARSAPRVIAVTAQETVRIPATLARLTAMIETQAPTPAAAQAAVSADSRSVLQFLERNRVDRLQAGALALYPVYGPAPSEASAKGESPPMIVAYRATWSANFEVEAERAGQIASGMIEAGVGRIGAFEFTATPEALAKAQQDAFRGAARRARENATAVLDALGYRAGDVSRVEVHPSGPVQPFSHRAEAMMAFSDRPSTPTAVEPGLIEVHGSVALEVGY